MVKGTSIAQALKHAPTTVECTRDYIVNVAVNVVAAYAEQFFFLGHN